MNKNTLDHVLARLGAEHIMSNKLLNLLLDKAMRGRAWDLVTLARVIGRPLGPRVEEHIVAQNDPVLSYHYALCSERPFPLGEPAIAKDPSVAIDYARDVLHGPFPAGEEAMATRGGIAITYAMDVLRGPFPLGERAIAEKKQWSLKYAQVLQGPFPLGEPAIAQDASYALDYARLLGKPFPLGEKAIAGYASYSLSYALSVLHGPFPAGEPAILTSSYKMRYLEFVARCKAQQGVLGA